MDAVVGSQVDSSIWIFGVTLNGGVSDESKNRVSDRLRAWVPWNCWAPASELAVWASSFQWACLVTWYWFGLTWKSICPSPGGRIWMYALTRLPAAEAAAPAPAPADMLIGAPLTGIRCRRARASRWRSAGWTSRTTVPSTSRGRH